tara:strand:+ start:406 stop:813 length:408 start_codon:yes stop_codon:yes gene_type:complete
MTSLNILSARNCYDKEKITVGMGATYHMWSDSYPYTVIKIHKKFEGKNYDILELQSDKHIPTKDCNYFENQSYIYERDLDGNIIYLKSYDYDHPEHGKKTIYHQVIWNKLTKRWKIVTKQPVSFGSRLYYNDPSF